MSLTVNNSGGSKSQRIASQRKILDEASRRRRARKGTYKFDSISMGVRVLCAAMLTYCKYVF